VTCELAAYRSTARMRSVFSDDRPSSARQSVKQETTSSSRSSTTIRGTRAARRRSSSTSCQTTNRKDCPFSKKNSRKSNRAKRKTLTRHRQKLSDHTSLAMTIFSSDSALKLSAELTTAALCDASAFLFS